jgi:hypothetical protein
MPDGTPADEADQAFEEIADKIIAYLSSPVPSAPDPPYRVGPCRSCGAEDCYATAEPWAAPLTLIEGRAYITGGFCCAHRIEWSAVGNCAHPMIEASHFKIERPSVGPKLPAEPCDAWPELGRESFLERLNP